MSSGLRGGVLAIVAGLEVFLCLLFWRVSDFSYSRDGTSGSIFANSLSLYLLACFLLYSASVVTVIYAVQSRKREARPGLFIFWLCSAGAWLLFNLTFAIEYYLFPWPYMAGSNSVVAVDWDPRQSEIMTQDVISRFVCFIIGVVLLSVFFISIKLWRRRSQM